MTLRGTVDRVFCGKDVRDGSCLQDYSRCDYQRRRRFRRYILQDHRHKSLGNTQILSANVQNCLEWQSLCGCVNHFESTYISLLRFLATSHAHIDRRAIFRRTCRQATCNGSRSTGLRLSSTRLFQCKCWASSRHYVDCFGFGQIRHGNESTGIQSNFQLEAGPFC